MIEHKSPSSIFGFCSMSALGLNKNARSRLKNDSESEECISSFAYALIDVLLKIRKLD